LKGKEQLQILWSGALCNKTRVSFFVLFVQLDGISKLSLFIFPKIPKAF